MNVGRYLSAARVRLHDGGEGGYALMTAILFILVLGVLSVLVLGMVVAQVKPTQFAQKNTRTIYAAQTGLEATITRIRSAVGAPDFTGAVYGSTTKLPCHLTGSVGQSTAPVTYQVDVSYFSSDPSGKSPTWLAANAFSCTDGNGTGTALPAYALISAQGQAPSSTKIASTMADRGISMVYQFQTTTTNVAGGRIWSWPTSTGATFCLRATSAAAGSTVTYQPSASCGADDNELWVYDTDYTIKLASSTLTGTPLCMTNYGNGNAIKLSACGTVDYTKQWAWDPDGKATWQAQNSSTENAGLCTGVQNLALPSQNAVLVVGTCSGSTPQGAFNPDPAVGPGAASVSTHQIVNYLEFGRCADVTDTDINKAFMISYPCKQDPPNGANLFWNHRWYYNEPLVGTTADPQQIIVKVNNSDTQQYCLQTSAAATSPGSTGVGTGIYPTFKPCTSVLDQKWTRTTADSSKLYSYTFRDNNGKCLSVSGSSKYLNLWSALTVANCDGSAAQKWNAPASQVAAQLGNYQEETRP